jgi:hypothetical protein
MLLLGARTQFQIVYLQYTVAANTNQNKQSKQKNSIPAAHCSLIS